MQPPHDVHIIVVVIIEAFYWVRIRFQLGAHSLLIGITEQMSCGVTFPGIGLLGDRPLFHPLQKNVIKMITYDDKLRKDTAVVRQAHKQRQRRRQRATKQGQPLAYASRHVLVEPRFWRPEVRHAAPGPGSPGKPASGAAAEAPPGAGTPPAPCWPAEWRHCFQRLPGCCLRLS